MPFDIRTERYLVYNVNNLSKKVDELAAGLKATLRRSDYDSPVFSFVPELTTQDPSRFIVAPDEFVRQLSSAQSRANARETSCFSPRRWRARTGAWSRSGSRVTRRWA